MGMDLPQPPQDTELRNIIDKLAQFVARNGPDFEQMTKNKQKGNGKFQFLYGGEYFHYYQYKVNAERAVLNKSQIMNGNSQIDWATTTTTTTLSSTMTVQDDAELERISQQQEALREQIKQSEQNLNAQHTVLLQQQQAQVEATVSECEMAELQQKCDACDLNLIELYTILEPIIDSCTKDSISNGKSWILQNASGSTRAECIARCLLYKAIHGTVPFSQKLHVIYLVNDVLHHCARKNAAELKDALESVAVPMFCNASVGATEEQKQKLDKLLKLWESKANYLASETVTRMRHPVASYQQYKTDQVARYGSQVAPLAQQTKATYDGYRAQHQAFVCHAMQQIVDFEQKKRNIENHHHHHHRQQIAAPAPAAAPIISLDTLQASIRQSLNSQQAPIDNDGSMSNGAPVPSGSEPSFLPPLNLNVPPPNMGGQQQQQQQPAFDIPPLNRPPPGFFPGAGVFPDFSKPPPGFVAKTAAEPIVVEESVVPSVPYYDLPAGLMVPLIKLEDTSFKPLDPKDIRLPPAMPTSERLLAAVDAFYALPTHERPRDSEGWEKLGLYEYYKSKNNAKREKEAAIDAGLRVKSRSPSPIQLPAEKEPSPPRRRYTSRSPSPPSSSTSSSRRRSRSRSPKRSSSKRRRKSVRRSTSRSRSRSRSRSFSPPPTKSLNRSPSTPPPPPSSSSSTFNSPPPFIKSETQELDPSNKGHQMLKKMGWGGSGLGANEQGIDSPISGGDVRDRQDQFKGIGCDLNDPYENFRKNKGAAFITRMKARAEERANESKVYE